jgi:O-antigen/teichoic acid export membrane protein
MWQAYRLGLHAMNRNKRFALPSLRLLAPELRYGTVVLAVSLAITLQYSIDIVLIKHYFDAHTAGLYAGVAAVARILFFLTASITQVMIPKVRQSAAPAENEATLRKSLILLGGISLLPLTIMLLFPRVLVGLLMGKTYLGFADLLPGLSVSVCIVAIINLLAAYYLSLRRYRVTVPVCAGALLTYILIILHHGSPKAIVANLLLGSTAALIATGAWILTERRYGAWNAKS